MIEIQDVSKKFNLQYALENITLNILNGHIFALAGPNGAGKSTLLRLLIGIYEPDAGTIRIDNSSPFKDYEVKSKSYFVPDVPFFIENSTPRSMAEYFSKIYPQWNRNMFIQLTHAFSLDLEKKNSIMSKGKQKQVSLALGLATTPKYLFLDEIFDGFDPAIRTLVKKIMIDYVADQNATIVIASHDLHQIEKICDDIAFLNEGSLVLHQNLEELKQNHFQVRVVFQNTADANLVRKQLNLAESSQRERMLTFTGAGNRKHLNNMLLAQKPIMCEFSPLNLEGIFMYNMEVAGYAIKTAF